MTEDCIINYVLKGNEIQKTVFVAFFQGERLKNRVKKVCEGFHASLYSCPTTEEDRSQTLKQVKTRLEDLKVVSKSNTSNVLGRNDIAVS